MLDNKQWENLSPQIRTHIENRYAEHRRLCQKNDVPPTSKAKYIEDYLLDPAPLEQEGYNPNKELRHYSFEVYISPSR